jgi:hypothetical protein
MLIRAVTIASIAVLLGSASVEARTLASGPNYGGSTVRNGGTVTCRLFNAGTTTVSVNNRRLITNTNSVVPLSSDSCGAPLGPEENCAFSAPITGNFAYSCLVNASGSTVSLLRGSIDVTNTLNSLLNSLPLQ